MAENFDPASITNDGKQVAKPGKDVQLVAQTDGHDDNPATKDPSGKLLESAQAANTKVAEIKTDDGPSLTEMGLVAGAFVAGAIGQRYGINREMLALAERSYQSLATTARGVADLSPYARVAARNVDTLGSGLATRLQGTLRLGGEIIDKEGKVFLSKDATVVSTTESGLLGLKPINAINRYGDAAQFYNLDGGVHSLASTIGKGPVRGFDIKYEVNSGLGPAYAQMSLRDGNKFAKVVGGHVTEGRGLFTDAQIEAALKQGQTTTDALYSTVLKTAVKA